MKFRDIILYDFLVDKKPFKPYIKRDIKNYYILIEFTEKDCAEIYNMVYLEILQNNKKWSY